MHNFESININMMLVAIKFPDFFSDFLNFRVTGFLNFKKPLFSRSFMNGLNYQQLDANINVRQVKYLFKITLA